MPNKYQFGWKTKAIACLGFLLILLAIVNQILVATNKFFEQNYLQFNKVVNLSFKSPLEIKKREVKIAEVIKIINEQPLPQNLTPIEQYICEKFGPLDCKVALAVARAESGMREDAINVNTNMSVDIGIFQINSVHFTKDGCSLKELVDPYKNVDCAYSLWRASGWNPWTAFKSGSFKDHI